MRTRSRNERNDDGNEDRGATMVEFALILPVLVMLLVGIIQFGIAYNTKLAMQAAAREGARAAALGRSESSVVAITSAAASPHTPDDIEVDECPDPGDPIAGAEAVVVVEKRFTISIPFVPDLPPADLSSTAVMRCGV